MAPATQHQARSEGPARPAKEPVRETRRGGTAAPAVSRALGNAALGRMLAPGEPVVVGALDDPLERQASSGGVPVGPAGPVGGVPAPEGAVAALRALSGGTPLPEPELRHHGDRLGHDLSRVRVHSGTPAAGVAALFGARALTVGDHVVLGADGTGSAVLGHELAHVVQQKRAGRPWIQRDPVLGPRPAGDEIDPLRSFLGLPKPDQLRFTERQFLDGSLPTVCPNCHRERPTTPLPPRLVDRDATESRLVEWAGEAKAALHQESSIRLIQLDPAAIDRLVDDYGVGLIRRLTASGEFDGSAAARERGAETIRRHWPEIRPPVRQGLVEWYQNELVTAIALTPRYAELVLQPDRLRRVLNTTYGERAPLGRHGAEAAVGQRFGVFEIDDIGVGQIWFHRPGRPQWRYQISQGDFIKHDPLILAVAEQVYDQTKWILEITPVLLKIGAFGLGFSGSIALVIAGIALDELAEEMKADTEGRPGRSPLEILKSAGIQLLVDRIFHGLFGGAAGRAVAATGRNAAKIERIAERAVPAIRRELVASEKTLVKDALHAGTARAVTDKALASKGYALEVAIENAGQRHVFRLTEKGTWCRFSTPICGLDLGADVVAAAKSPASFTKGRLEETRALLTTVENDISFLGRTYERMRKAGRMDLSLLGAEERRLLDELAPSGKAADLTLAELRDLPGRLGLKREFAAATGQEAALVRQLYREGRPLYEVMRAASPNYASRSRVLVEAAGRDAASQLRPRSGVLHVDHVVPLNDIVRMPGFDKLRPERQLEIVNDLRNLRAVDGLANSSRGDRSWHAWTQALVHYDAAMIARMRALEDELRTYLAQRILALGRG